MSEYLPADGSFQSVMLFLTKVSCGQFLPVWGKNWANGKSDTLIPASGVLSGPKGMGIKDDYFFICDVNKVVVYNLADLSLAPVSLFLPEGDLFVNDIVIMGDVLYVAVTNSGKLYTLDVSDPAKMKDKTFEFYALVPGANGITTDGNKLFVAS